MKSKPADISRRTFLRTASGAVVGFVIIPVAACESNLVAPITSGEAVSFLTPNEEFFVRAGAEISNFNWKQPTIAAGDWRLEISGLVDTPQTVTYTDLLQERNAGHETRFLKTLRCVLDSNEIQGLTGTAIWSGIPLRIFLDRAGIKTTQAKRLRIFGYDGFTNNITVERAVGPFNNGLLEPVLVTHMNGEVLSPDHGAPVRLILNEAFGFKNVKWIQKIEVTDENSNFGTYQDAGFDDNGVMTVNSRITDPLQNSVFNSGAIRLAGFALSGNSGIRSVDVSVNGSAFEAASLGSLIDESDRNPEISDVVQVKNNAAFPFRGVWVKWHYDVTLPPGVHTLRVRASDSAGNVQPDQDTSISDGINTTPTVRITLV